MTLRARALLAFLSALPTACAPESPATPARPPSAPVAVPDATPAADPPRAAAGPPPSPPAEDIFLASAEPLTAELVTAVVGHARAGMTSGNRTPGTVADVAFLGPDGRLLATVGNDNRARVVDLDTGKTIWTGPKLRHDLDALATCGDLFAAQTYGFDVALYRVDGRRVKGAGTVPLGGAMAGLVRDCTQLVGQPLHGGVDLYDLAARDVREKLLTVQYVKLHSNVQDGWMFVHHQDGVVLRNLATRARSDYEIPPSPLGAASNTVQAWVVDDRRILLEYCDQKSADGGRSCVVRITDWEGATVAQHLFDVDAGVWVLTVPSTVGVSADATYFSFYRDGLPVTAVEMASGRRTDLDTIERTMSATVQPRWSPVDAGLLAVPMTPKPWMVSIYRVAG